MMFRDETLKMYREEAEEIVRTKGAPKPEQMMKIVAALPLILDELERNAENARRWLWEMEHYRDWYHEACTQFKIEPQEVPPLEVPPLEKRKVVGWNMFT